MPGLVLVLAEAAHAPESASGAGHAGDDDDSMGARVELLYLGLSVLVNLGDLGAGIDVINSGGLDLLASLLRVTDGAVRYYACAGVQNLTAYPEAAARIRGTGVEEMLQELLDYDSDEIARCAAGALANSRRFAQDARVVDTDSASAASTQGASDVGSGLRARRGARVLRVAVGSALHALARAALRLEPLRSLLTRIRRGAGDEPMPEEKDDAQGGFEAPAAAPGPLTDGPSASEGHDRGH